jgi:NhaP-type Na+/H+ or K+/H+ antiporter
MVLLVGTLSSVLAYSLKTSDVFILLLTGMIFNRLGLLVFDKDIIIIISILALIFVVFNSTFKFSIKDVKKHMAEVLKLNISYLSLCLVILTISILYLFGLEKTTNSILIAMLCSILIYGTDPTVLQTFFKKTKNKFVEIIEIESLINTSLTVIIASLILVGLGGSKFQLIPIFSNPIFSFFQSILIGILFAFLIGWVVIAILKNNYFGDLTHLGVLTSAIIVYVGSEYIGGSGVLAIATFGLLFSSSHISHLIEIERFESIITNSMKILTFILLGTIITINPGYIFKGTIIFLIYILIRFVSVMLVFMKKKTRLKEMIFITLNVPKGIDVAIILLLIISVYSNIKNIEIVINTVMLMILYTVALSSVTSQFSGFFLNKKGKKIVKKI